MRYFIEVLIKTVGNDGSIVENWVKVRPNNGAPYVFDTEKQAEAILNMCYPRGTPTRFNQKVRVIGHH